MFFLGFDLKDIICANFHGHICNQQVKIHSIESFKVIGGISLSEVHPIIPGAVFEFPSRQADRDGQKCENGFFEFQDLRKHMPIKI